MRVTAIFRFVLLFSCKYISTSLRGRRIIDLCRKTVFLNKFSLLETAHFLSPKNQSIFRFRIKYSFPIICLNRLLCLGFSISFIGNNLYKLSTPYLILTFENKPFDKDDFSPQLLFRSILSLLVQQVPIAIGIFDLIDIEYLKLHSYKVFKTLQHLIKNLKRLLL